MELTTPSEGYRNFIGIQQQSGIAAEGYTSMPLSTGYDRVLAHRVDDQFAYAAEQDGKVTTVTDDVVVIEYKDGTEKRIELGRRFGKAKDLTIPHQLTTGLRQGQKIKKGDIVSYNSNFFQPDLLNPTQVVWRAGVVAKTALLESTDTLEDSSVISSKMAEQLTTTLTKVREIVLKFDQAVMGLVSEGTEVEVEDVLCTIEDSITAGGGLFDESSVDTLQMLAAQNPKAKYGGVVERIEVYYNGDKEDMSDSLRKLANRSDRKMKARASLMNEPAQNGKVDSNFRVAGNPLGLDTLAIKVYITGRIGCSCGDKGVFGNQLKTVFGRVMTGRNETETGEEIDAIFGYESISNRIVNSPIVIGTTNTILRLIGEQAVKAYKGE